MTSLILIIVLILGGGASLAAEQAVPGDALYPLKISLNETIRAATSLSAETKAGWEARVAERRLEEAEKLAARENFTVAFEERIESHFEEYADRAQERIEEFQSRGELSVAADVAAQFEMSLLAHEQILARIAAEKPSERAQIEILLIKVRAEAQETSQLREDAEAGLSADVSAETKIYAERARGEAEEEITETKLMVERMKASLSASVVAKIESRLQIAEETLAMGVARFNAGAYGEAVIFFSRAKQFAHQANVLLEADEDIDVDLNIENDLEIEEVEEIQVQGETEVRVNY